MRKIVILIIAVLTSISIVKAPVCTTAKTLERANFTLVPLNFVHLCLGAKEPVYEIGIGADYEEVSNCVFEYDDLKVTFGEWYDNDDEIAHVYYILESSEGVSIDAVNNIVKYYCGLEKAVTYMMDSCIVDEKGDICRVYVKSDCTKITLNFNIAATGLLEDYQNTIYHLSEL